MRRCSGRGQGEESISGAIGTADENGLRLMLPDAALPLPASLMRVLAWFPPLFTAPSFRTFTVLATGFLAQTGKRTVRHAGRDGTVPAVAA